MRTLFWNQGKNLLLISLKMVNIFSFCNNHGKKNNPPMDIPIDLTVMIEFMMQKILMKLAEKFRGYVSF